MRSERRFGKFSGEASLKVSDIPHDLQKKNGGDRGHSTRSNFNHVTETLIR